MKVEEINIDELKEYENNPRNNDEAVEYVANSIKEFGFKVPIVIDKNKVIIAGHTRLKASKQLGLKKVPCIVADDLTPEQIKAFRLADNKVSEKATWNFEKLDLELQDIDFEMVTFGFDLIDDEKEENLENDEYEYINDEELENANSKIEHYLSIDKTKIAMTDEEYTKITDILNNYIETNGVSFGFVNNLLKEV